VRIDIGIIGGTGIGDRLQLLGGVPIQVTTQSGIFRAMHLDYKGISVALLSRHSAGHKDPPHRVPYAALAHGLQALEARFCLATAAVGSLEERNGPGTMIVCRDFLDFTNRQPTLFRSEVSHTDFTEPFSDLVCRAFIAAGQMRSVEVLDNGVYVCVNGPRYETPHEIQVFRQLGGSIVGMTAVSEAIVMREADIPYGCLSIVTNFASGISATPLNHQEVVLEMERSGEHAVNILLESARLLMGG
jgi:5'-methylthioadenosine phosphorylase